MTSVREDAPWCPRNIEFIRRANGLADEAEVKRIVYDASYLVLGLGDVYLGAPVATPIDPRHRLVTTKYNPVRTWTPENAVGIGGAYLCIYGMEGPAATSSSAARSRSGTVIARTVVSGRSRSYSALDELRFYEVSNEELMDMRRDFPLGRLPLQIEETTFSLAEHEAFDAREAESIAAFRSGQQAARAERARWNGGSDVRLRAPTARAETMDENETRAAKPEEVRWQARSRKESLRPVPRLLRGSRAHRRVDEDGDRSAGAGRGQGHAGARTRGHPGGRRPGRRVDRSLMTGRRIGIPAVLGVRICRRSPSPEHDTRHPRGWSR